MKVYILINSGMMNTKNIILLHIKNRGEKQFILDIILIVREKDNCHLIKTLCKIC